MAASESSKDAPIIISCRLTGPVYGDQTVNVSVDVSKAAPPEVRDDASGPYSFEYTGRHDGGELPPTSDNFYAHLVAALRDAKAQSDVILAAGVKAATSDSAGSSAAAGAGAPPSPKRARSADPPAADATAAPR